MAGIRVKWVVISIAPATQAICTIVIKALLPHNLYVQDNTLRVGIEIPMVGKFAMCESTVQAAVQHKSAHNT
jgi:hypothetical protein